MNTNKQGIIRLGRSKSQKGRNKSITSSQYRPNSSNNSFDSEQIQQTSILNRSLHLQQQRAHGSREKIWGANQNLTNSHGPSPHRLVTKQKMVSPERNAFKKSSPIRSVVISDQRPKIVQKENINNESHFLRKIKMLQQRVQQLHHQKQISLVRAYEDGRKINQDYIFLQNQLAGIQNLKNQQILALKSEVQCLQNHIIKQNESISFHENNKKTNNSASTVIEANHSNSQNQEKKKLFQQLQQTSKQYSNKISILQQQNQNLSQENTKLKAQIVQMKDMIINTTAVIEQNNQSIIQNYQQKINILQNQLQQIKYKVINQSTLEESLDNNRKEISDWMKKFIEKDAELSEKTKQLSEKENQCEMYRKSWEESKIEVLEYTEKLLKKNQEMTLQEEEFITRINEISNNSQLNEQKASGANSRIKSLEEQLEKFSEISSDKTQKQKIPQPCKRCQELIKTLAKLNQKAFSQTS